MMTIDETEAKLPDVIERALKGEAVVITRRGKPLVEVTASAQGAPRALSDAEWSELRKGRETRRVSINSAELVRQMRDEGY